LRFRALALAFLHRFIFHCYTVFACLESDRLGMAGSDRGSIEEICKIENLNSENLSEFVWKEGRRHPLKSQRAGAGRQPAGVFLPWCGNRVLLVISCEEYLQCPRLQAALKVWTVKVWTTLQQGAGQLQTSKLATTSATLDTKQ